MRAATKPQYGHISLQIMALLTKELLGELLKHLIGVLPAGGDTKQLDHRNVIN